MPTAYGFQDVVVKGFVDEVAILCGGQEIARRPRCYGEGVFVSNPLHYLALIEMKPSALDQAAALPEVFQHLRHLLEARLEEPAQARVYPGPAAAGSDAPPGSTLPPIPTCRRWT